MRPKKVGEKHMAQGVPAFWRRRFYVHPIQRKYFFLSLVPLLFFASMTAWLVFIPLNLALQGPSPDLEKVAALGQLQGAGGGRIWLAIFISMAISAIISLFVTHKFAGPLYRIEQILRKVEEGHFPTSVRIRHGDDIQQLAGMLESAFKAIASALKGIQEQQALAAQELAALRRRVQAGSNGDILRGLERIGRSHKEIENILASFKIHSQRGPDAEPAEEQG
jgi:methyl-accepting chemotaxis protein